uniref:Secreted protein n=1 Tax=Panagrellus redivivus TaxID=6233 RepID=A0A7E4VPE3_PANRE
MFLLFVPRIPSICTSGHSAEPLPPHPPVTLSSSFFEAKSRSVVQIHHGLSALRPSQIPIQLAHHSGGGATDAAHRCHQKNR